MPSETEILRSCTNSLTLRKSFAKLWREGEWWGVESDLWLTDLELIFWLSSRAGLSVGTAWRTRAKEALFTSGFFACFVSFRKARLFSRKLLHWCTAVSSKHTQCCYSVICSVHIVEIKIVFPKLDFFKSNSFCSINDSDVNNFFQMTASSCSSFIAWNILVEQTADIVNTFVTGNCWPHIARITSLLLTLRIPFFIFWNCLTTVYSVFRLRKPVFHYCSACIIYLLNSSFVPIQSCEPFFTSSWNKHWRNFLTVVLSRN